MKVITDEKLVDDLLDRGISQILPEKESFKELLMSGQRIKIYEGFDPTADKLHIGNALGLKILERFRKLGHHVVFLIGTGTGKVGDPTDKSATRSVLSKELIENNIKGWKEQASKILDFDNEENPVEIVMNGDWLDPMTFADFLELGNLVTVGQLLERDMFQERIKNNKPISISEMLYPIMQGYDSVAMEVDAEFGGTDQLFNMMMGRTLLKQLKNKEKWVLTGKILEDNNGIKMGKSLGNVINLTDEPKDIYGKVMSITDGLIVPGFELITDIPMSEVGEIKNNLENGANPMEYKKKLAFLTTKWLSDEEAANEAQKHFEDTVQNQEIPDEIDEVEYKLSSESNLSDLLAIAFPEMSGGDRKRVVKQGGFSLDDEKITDPGLSIDDKLKDGSILKLGKRNYKKVILK